MTDCHFFTFLSVRYIFIRKTGRLFAVGYYCLLLIIIITAHPHSMGRGLERCPKHCLLHSSGQLTTTTRDPYLAVVQVHEQEDEFLLQLAHGMFGL